MSYQMPPPLQPPPQAEHIPNHLVWAILSTVLCCLPFGIVSIVYAARVDGKVLSGDLQGARNDSRLAANWAIASAAGFLLMVLVIVLLSIVGSIAEA
jgi:hypothetical protein